MSSKSDMSSHPYEYYYNWVENLSIIFNHESISSVFIMLIEKRKQINCPTNQPTNIKYIGYNTRLNVDSGL